MSDYNELLQAFIDSPAYREYTRHVLARELALYDSLANDAMSEHTRVLTSDPEPNTSCGVLHASAAAEQKGPQIGHEPAATTPKGSVQASSPALPPVVSSPVATESGRVSV